MSIKKIINKSVVLYTLYILITGLFFLWYLFPSEYFADYIEKTIAAKGQGINIQIGTVKPSFPAGLKMTDVKVMVPSIDQPVALDYIKAQAGLVSLVKFAPEVSLSAGLFGGKIKGKITTSKGKTKKFAVTDISVSGIDLGTVSSLAGEKLPGFSLKGRLNGKGEYSSAGRGQGKINANLSELVVKLDVPILTLESLSFSEVKGDVEVKNKRILIDECIISGNEFDGTLKGSVVIKQPFGRTVLRLSGTFSPEKEFTEKVPLDLLFNKKVKPGVDQKFKITGTVSKPKLR